MLSMILGVGAVLTGYFGMNFGKAFEVTFIVPGGSADAAHRIVANWSDHRDIFWIRRKS